MTAPAGKLHRHKSIARSDTFCRVCRSEQYRMHFSMLCHTVLCCSKLELHAGVDVQAVIQDLPAFVSSFDYSVVSQTFLQQPAAAGRTAHLDTLSIQHAAEALQVHGCTLLDQAQEAVTKVVTGHMQELCDVLSQQEVVTVLEAAHAAIRASADTEGQGLAALQQQQQQQQQQHNQSQASDSMRQDTNASTHASAQDAASSSCGSSDTHRVWLEDLSDAQLVEHAGMVQAGLQQQQLADAYQNCLDCIAGLLTGALA